jgi:hypothetical protein
MEALRHQLRRMHYWPLYYCIFSARVLVHMSSASFSGTTGESSGQKFWTGAVTVPRNTQRRGLTGQNRRRRKKSGMLASLPERPHLDHSVFLGVSDSDYHRPYADCTRCRHGRGHCGLLL